MLKKCFIRASIVLLVFFSACDPPEDSVIAAVNNTNAVLNRHVWTLEELTLKVRNEDIPPPLLFNSSGATLEAGFYDLENTVLDASEMRKYEVEFNEDRKIITRNGLIDLLIEDEIGSYFVFNERTIRITSAQSVNYTYIYEPSTREFSIIADEENAAYLIRKTNDKLVDRVASGSPGKVGDVISSLLFNNEALQQLINNTVVSALSGQLEFINEIDPEELSSDLAVEIRTALEQIDWQTVLSQLLQEQLEDISNIDVELVAEAIATAVSDYVNETLTEETLYDFVFPYIEQIAINSEEVTEFIATLVVDLFNNIFNEENLQPILAGAWNEFVSLNDEQVSEIAGILTNVIEENFINQESVASTLLPFTQLIDETPLLQLGNLATQATESIENLVNNLNEQIPDLNLNPDYESMQDAIRLAFIGIKPVISIVGPEGAANDVASLVLSQFLTTENINTALVAAINFFQTIDPETAGTTLSQWLLSLEDDISEALLNTLRDLLSPILDNLNPEETALNIAIALNSFITENITPENLQNLIEPIIQEIVNLNAEEVANFLAELILGLDIIQDNVTEEAIREFLLPVLQSVQETNVEELSQNIINAIVASGIFEETITEERVSLIISILIYKATWDNVLIANNFEEVTITLRHD
jgi:hypothetical protein